jgi:hypothetical protein
VVAAQAAPTRRGCLQLALLTSHPRVAGEPRIYVGVTPAARSTDTGGREPIRVQTLTIKSATLESARGFLAGLEAFQAELSEAEDGSYLVQITFSGGDREIIALLNALEDFVTHRNDGPVEVGLAGRSYELHPSSPGAPAIPAAGL